MFPLTCLPKGPARLCRGVVHLSTQNDSVSYNPRLVTERHPGVLHVREADAPETDNSRSLPQRGHFLSVFPVCSSSNIASNMKSISASVFLICFTLSPLSLSMSFPARLASSLHLIKSFLPVHHNYSPSLTIQLRILLQRATTPDIFLIIPFTHQDYSPHG